MITKHRIPLIAALSFCVLFILFAIPWIDRPGIQTDEALFAAGIYPPFDPRSTVRIFGHRYPLMIMTYVGALKSAVWACIFGLFPPSPASVRIPAVLLSSLSVFWLYQLLSRTVGVRAGLAGAALLATDPIYILYSRWDHGPVVIQHLCLVGSLLAFVRFHQERKLLWLFLASFALGLGIWEKAVFLWFLAGIGIAGPVVFFPEIRSLFSIRRAAVAAAAFLIGAMPLIIFNLRNDFTTIKSNTVWSSDELSVKAQLLRSTLEGDALFGSMMREEWDGPLRPLTSMTERATVAISSAVRAPRRDWMGYLFVLTLLLIPFVWRTPAFRAALFALIVALVAWLQMAFTKGAGGGAHHTILLWPLPALAIGAVLGAFSGKIRHGGVLLASVCAGACIANLLVLSTYYTNLLRNGGTSSWTDAMYPAISAILQMDRKGIVVIDWGFYDTIRLFDQGRTPLFGAEDPVDPPARAASLFQIKEPGNVFITHTQNNETFPGRTTRLIQLAEENGYRPVDRRIFLDSNGRETVEIFRFRLKSDGGVVASTAALRASAD